MSCNLPPPIHIAKVNNNQSLLKPCTDFSPYFVFLTVLIEVSHSYEHCLIEPVLGNLIPSEHAVEDFSYQTAMQSYRHLILITLAHCQWGSQPDSHLLNWQKCNIFSSQVAQKSILDPKILGTVAVSPWHFHDVIATTTSSMTPLAICCIEQSLIRS